MLVQPIHGLVEVYKGSSDHERTSEELSSVSTLKLSWKALTVSIDSSEGSSFLFRLALTNSHPLESVRVGIPSTTCATARCVGWLDITLCSAWVKASRCLEAESLTETLLILDMALKLFCCCVRVKSAPEYLSAG